MAKALIVHKGGAAEVSGNKNAIIGGTGTTTTEANVQYYATEGATCSNLWVNITGGGNGANTCRFRKNGADGNLVTVRTGTGTQEDATNSDALSATDLFNFALSDTGTDPIYAAQRVNVEFASGYGSFFGATGAAGIVFDDQNTTRFIPLAGTLAADGNSTEAPAAFKCRGASVFEAFRVFVVSNARTNDSVIRNRINGANGSGVITIGAGATGSFTATGLNDAIADGNTINLSITLVSGVQDLVLSMAGATLKDSGNEMETWCSLAAGEVRAASATASYYCIGGQLAAVTPESSAAIPMGFANTARNLRIYVAGNTYSTNATLTLRVAGGATLTVTITAGAANQWFEVTSGTASIGAGDLVAYEIVGGTSGSLTPTMIGFTYAPTGAAAPAFAGALLSDKVFRIVDGGLVI